MVPEIQKIKVIKIKVMLVKEMKKYFHSDDLDYSIGVWNEETEEMEYDNSVDVPNGEYPVFDSVFSVEEINKPGYEFVAKVQAPKFTMETGMQLVEQNVYHVTADEKLVVVDGKFDAEQLSRIASDVKAKTEYWGCYLETIKPLMFTDGEFAGMLKVGFGS